MAQTFNGCWSRGRTGHTTAQLSNRERCLQADRDIVLAAVQRQGLALKYAGDSCKSDREVALAAVRHSGRALEYA
eukprot:1358659-Amphidinium_carterae.1